MLKIRGIIFYSLIFLLISSFLFLNNLFAKEKYHNFPNKRVNLDLKYHHPIDIPVKKPVDLPLQQSAKGEVIVCRTCHIDHQGKLSHSYDSYGKLKIIAGSPKNLLNMSGNELCSKCHISVHHWDKNKKINVKNKNVDCLECHNAHKPLQDINKSCSVCHKKQNQIHPPLKSVARIFKFFTLNIKLQNQRITCYTCHNEKKFMKNNKNHLRSSNQIINFCSTCHDTNVSRLFSKYHQYFKTK